MQPVKRIMYPLDPFYVSSKDLLCIRDNCFPETALSGRMDNRTCAPGAVDGSSIGSRGRPSEKTFCSDEVTARKFTWELAGIVFEIVFIADGTGLVFDVVGMEDLGLFQESVELNSHG